MSSEPELFDSSLETELQTLSDRREEEEEEEENEKDEEQKKPETDKDTLALRARVAEVQSAERTRVVTELLYLVVCNRFKALGVPLIPPVKGGGDIKFDPIDLGAFATDKLYSADALEMVKEHLFMATGGGLSPSNGAQPVATMAVVMAGQAYVMSALFGYMVRRADERYRLEKLMGGFMSGDSVSATDAGPDGGAKTLKDYVQSFGPEDAQQMTTVLSVEATMAMQSQVSALFGDLRQLKEKIVDAMGPVESPQEAQDKMRELIATDQVETLRMTADDLKRMVLEAVSFGTLLNEAEKKIDGVYELTPAPRLASFGLGDGDERRLPE